MTVLLAIAATLGENARIVFSAAAAFILMLVLLAPFVLGSSKRLSAWVVAKIQPSVMHAVATATRKVSQ